MELSVPASLCRPLCHRENGLPHQLNRKFGGLSSRSELQVEKNLLLLRGSERRFLGCKPRSLVCWLRHAISLAHPRNARNYMSHSFYGAEQGSLSVGQEILRLLWRAKVPYHTKKSHRWTLFHTSRMQSTFRHPLTFESLAHRIVLYCGRVPAANAPGCTAT